MSFIFCIFFYMQKKSAYTEQEQLFSIENEKK